MSVKNSSKQRSLGIDLNTVCKNLNFFKHLPCFGSSILVMSFLVVFRSSVDAPKTAKNAGFHCVHIPTAL